LAHLPWRVAKFGGSSVGTPSNWPRIARVCRDHLGDGTRPLLVCSALSRVTDLLETLLVALEAKGDPSTALTALRARHEEAARDMGVSADDLPELDWLAGLARRGEAPSDRIRAEVLSSGERLSTRLGVRYLRNAGLDAGWVDVREHLDAATGGAETADYLSAECHYAPDPTFRARLAARPEPVLVTQGFTAANARGETVVLGRGGSDTSAAYLASRLEADRLEIWTDVPGTFTTNPRLVEHARLLRRVSLDEVTTMAALGAKVLHPRSLEPSLRYGVPLEIRWTKHPELGPGTRIDADAVPGVKAIAYRKKMTSFTMERDPSWQPIGFLADVATCFSDFGVSMDLVSSSPGSIKATVDRAAVPHLDEVFDGLVAALSETCRVTARRDVASVSFVGHQVSRCADLISPALEELGDDALHFVAHSSEDVHITYVVEEQAADQLVKRGHEQLFAEELVDPDTFGPTWQQLSEPGVVPTPLFRRPGRSRVNHTTAAVPA